MSLYKHIFYTISYYRNPPWDTGITPPEVLEFISQNPPGRALDLGCGTGVNAITLAQHGWQVAGIDFVGRAIRQARRKARQASVQVDFRQGDVTRLDDLHGPFDLALDIGCFHSLSPAGRATYAANLERLLRPQGVFLMYAFVAPPGEVGMGLQTRDLELLERCLHLVNRNDGTDRGQRPSAWFTYQRREEPSHA